ISQAGAVLTFAFDLRSPGGLTRRPEERWSAFQVVEPTGEDRDRGGRGVFERQIHDESLSIRRDVERIPATAKLAGFKQSVWEGEFGAIIYSRYSNRHQGSRRRYIVQFGSVPFPARKRAATGREPAASFSAAPQALEALYIHLGGPGFIGLICQPFSVGR